MEPPPRNTSGNITSRFPPSPCHLHACRYSVGEKVAFILSLSVIFFVILLGNSLLCYLIFKEKKLRRSPTWISILNLAISDMLIAVFCMPILVIQIYLVESWQFGQAICTVLPFFLNVGWISAIIILTIISTEKFMAVCLPFKCSVLKSSFVKVGIFLAWMTALVDSLYYTVMADKKIVTVSGKKYCVETWSLSENKHFLVTNIVLFYFIPLFVILGLHTAIIIKLKLKTSRELRESFANSQRLARRRNSTEAVKVLLVIALCFAVFMTPYEAYTLIVLLSPKPLEENTEFHLFAVTLWLFFFNLSTHPFIYGLLSNKYKMALKKEISIITLRTSDIRAVRFLQLDRAERENKL